MQLIRDHTLKQVASSFHIVGLCLGLLASLLSAPVSAELAISQLIIEFGAGSLRAKDIEIFNDSPDRSFVSVEPREIIEPGTPNEHPFTSRDPEKLGILASPARLVLEPHQRRTLRIAVIGPQSENERVYRVTVKPVTGDVAGDESGLKLLVGYDLLVLVRPSVKKTDIRVMRAGHSLMLINHGNSSVELSDGKQCDENGKNCQSLPGKRLYAGASWEQSLPRLTEGEYRARSVNGWSVVKF